MKKLYETVLDFSFMAAIVVIHFVVTSFDKDFGSEL